MSSQKEDNTKYLQIQTPDHNFEIKITKKEDNYLMLDYSNYYFTLGDDKMPFLEGIVKLYNKSNPLIYNTVDLTRIRAIEQCSEEDINQGYSKTHTFGKDVLDAFIFLINSQFSNIKTIRLNDTTYLPYRTDTESTLDLLTYSIGLYKKTWYEERLKAYILPKEKHEEYRKQVEEYASKHTKNCTPFFHIYHIMQMNNVFAANILSDNMQKYEKMYEESESLPEFCQSLSKTINLEKNVNFSKDG